MKIDPIYISIFMSLGVSLIISSAYAIFMYLRMKKADEKWFPSAIEESVYRAMKEFEKRQKDFETKVANELQIIKKEQQKTSTAETNQTSQEEDRTIIVLSSKNKEKYNNTSKKPSKTEKQEKGNAEKDVPHKIIKPEGVVYEYLGVSEGKLVLAVGNQPTYFRAWVFEGKRYYEFFCDDSIIKKAINNRSAVIDPYCEKHPDSIPPDESTSVETTNYGILNSDFNITQKAIIKYIK